jgi:two-component system OmpR family response regulator
MHILIAEDDPSIAESVAYALRSGGHAVDWVQSGSAADAALTAHHFDLLILDLGLPRMDGFELLRRARARGERLPILILTARDSLNDKVRGLDLGADDYVVKPFSISELEARVRALGRRGDDSATPQVRIGKLKFDNVHRVVWVDEKPRELSARELAVLEVLLRRPGLLVTKDQLVDGIFQWGEEVTANAIEVYISRLRKKLEDADVKITTVRGLGYRLEGKC